jgi:hypothetical protein
MWPVIKVVSDGNATSHGHGRRERHGNPRGIRNAEPERHAGVFSNADFERHHQQYR